MLIVIDNYDSFTYNLVQYLGELGANLKVFRNDQVKIESIDKLKPGGIIISPGPCTPNEAGISLGLIQKLHGKYPILGVCLGHQSIGQAFGAKIIRAPKPVHGKTAEILHDGKTIFKEIANPFVATRYHSLIVEKESLPDCLEISAWTSDGLIMGLRHKKEMVEGIQFHPESILTTAGKDILRNFLEISSLRGAKRRRANRQAGGNLGKD